MASDTMGIFFNVVLVITVSLLLILDAIPLMKYRGSFSASFVLVRAFKPLLRTVVYSCIGYIVAILITTLVGTRKEYRSSWGMQGGSLVACYCSYAKQFKLPGWYVEPLCGANT